MKEKEPPRVERRRSMVDLNLVGERRDRPRLKGRGCLSFLPVLFLAVAVAGVAVRIAGLA